MPAAGHSDRTRPPESATLTKDTTNPRNMLNDPEEQSEEDDGINQAEPPAYMSQPMMQAYADRLMSLIDDFYEESTDQPITPEALAFRDALITVYQRIVVAGEVDELTTRLRTLFPCAVYDMNPTAWDDLLEFRMSTIN